MTALGILWYLLIFVLIAGYFVLDGFDLGAGVLYPLIAKTEAEKSIVRQAIGPVWDGNEVWLLTAGGALFAAFPAAYATSFSGFYLAIMLVLFGLILRAVSLEFRAHETSLTGLIDVLFIVGSFLPALLFGVAVGNIIEGIPMDANGDYTGSFFALLNPFALLCGVLGLVHMLAQGSAWIAFKAPVTTELRTRAAKLRKSFVLIDIVVFVLVTIVFFVMVLPSANYTIACMPLAVLGAFLFVVGGVIAVIVGKPDQPGKDLLAFLGIEFGCVGLVVIWAASLFPLLIPGIDSSIAINVANAASGDTTLFAMTIIACIGVPIVLVYHILVYRAFRGRIDS